MSEEAATTLKSLGSKAGRHSGANFSVDSLVDGISIVQVRKNIRLAR